MRAQLQGVFCKICPTEAKKRDACYSSDGRRCGADRGGRPPPGAVVQCIASGRRKGSESRPVLQPDLHLPLVPEGSQDTRGSRRATTWSAAQSASLRACLRLSVSASRYFDGQPTPRYKGPAFRHPVSVSSSDVPHRRTRLQSSSWINTQHHDSKSTPTNSCPRAYPPDWSLPQRQGYRLPGSRGRSRRQQACRCQAEEECPRGVRTRCRQVPQGTDVQGRRDAGRWLQWFPQRERE